MPTPPAAARAPAPGRRAARNGKYRCRMHGGSAASGAPRGNRNAWKHGRRSAAHAAWKRSVVRYLRATDHVLRVVHLILQTRRAYEKMEKRSNNPMHPGNGVRMGVKLSLRGAHG